MKKLLLVLATIISTTASAIDFGCVTEIPTTTFVAQTEDDFVQIQLFHHNGVKYAPVWNNLITMNDLPVITERAKLLAELGEHLKFSMPSKNCQINGNLLNCFGFQPSIEINGHQVSLWSVYTVASTEVSHAGEFNYIEANLALDIDGQTVFVPMKYSDWECFNNFKKKGHLKKPLL